MFFFTTPASSAAASSSSCAQRNVSENLFQTVNLQCSSIKRTTGAFESASSSVISSSSATSFAILLNETCLFVVTIVACLCNTYHHDTGQSPNLVLLCFFLHDRTCCLCRIDDFYNDEMLFVCFEMLLVLLCALVQVLVRRLVASGSQK